MMQFLLAFLLLFSAPDSLTIENDYRDRITVYRMCGMGQAGRLADVEAHSRVRVKIDRCPALRFMVRFHPSREVAYSERVSTLPGELVLMIDPMGNIWDTIKVARQSTI